MRKKNTKKIIIILSAVLAVLLAVLVLFASGIINLGKKEEPTPEEEIVVVVEDPDSKKKEEYHKIYNENKSINPDYVGELMFDSGLVNVSFVQAKSVYKENGELYTFYTEDGRLVTNGEGYNGNDVYIWTYWKTGEYDYNNNGGSTFMDYRNDLSDQNLIVYGHHFSEWNDPDRNKAFTPLEQLMEKENYAANKYVTLILENQIRKYELVSVYQFDATDSYYLDNMQYWRTNYGYDDYTGESNPDYYKNYISAIKEKQLYDTGLSLTDKDKTLTLQTCIGGHAGELFEILVLREISNEAYQKAVIGFSL